MDRKTNKEKWEENLAAAAYLAGTKCMTQKDIASYLKLSTSTVNRLLDAAVKRNILRRRQYFFLGGESLQALAEARIHKTVIQGVLDNVSRKYCGRKGPEVNVVSSGDYRDENCDWQKRLNAFGAAAAGSVARLIRGSRYCAVSWGSTVGSVLEHLRNTDFIERAGGPISVFPVAGDPLGYNNQARYSSSNLAELLERTVNGNLAAPRSIAMVPAIIPPELFTEDEKRGIWKLIDLVTPYTDLFGFHQDRSRESPLHIGNIDLIITSLSTDSRVFGFGSGRLLDEFTFNGSRYSQEMLLEILAADLAGVCIKREGMRTQMVGRYEALRDGLTGMKLEHLIECAKKADTGAGGVCCLACAGNKARPVLECVKRGLISHLICDDQLANRLELEAKKELAKSGGMTFARLWKESSY